MNIIFVDIDGPLLPTKLHILLENHRTGLAQPPLFDMYAIRVFNIWARYSNAKIVFSTNWAVNVSEKDLKRYMEVNGLGFDYHEHCITPKRMRSERHEEIVGWLREHSKEGDRFIVVDDDPKCKYISNILNNQDSGVEATGEWIEVDLEDGMTRANYLDGCEALGIDIDIVNNKEFGIKILTQEEKDAQLKALSLFV